VLWICRSHRPPFPRSTPALPPLAPVNAGITPVDNLANQLVQVAVGLDGRTTSYFSFGCPGAALSDGDSELTPSEYTCLRRCYEMLVEAAARGGWVRRLADSADVLKHTNRAVDNVRRQQDSRRRFR